MSPKFWSGPMTSRFSRSPSEGYRSILPCESHNLSAWDTYEDYRPAYDNGGQNIDAVPLLVCHREGFSN